ncbi:MAG: hypothetical protein PHI97_24345 [Desulfobulbus sp.]|nr:hypothetical protein [Desulfobulbus sp.]
MRRLALLTVFFYVCTFAAPQRAQAVAPVALIAAAAVGTAMMSASIGTYYAQNGVMPAYVSATAGAVASAADKIFQPSYLAVGAYSLFTPASLNTAKDFYIGKAASIGATVGDIVDFVQSSSDGLYDSLKSLIKESLGGSSIDKGFLAVNDVFKIPGFTDGKFYKVLSPPGILADPVTPATWNTWTSGKTCWTWGTTQYAYFSLQLWTYPESEQRVYAQSLSLTTDPLTINPTDGSIEYPTLKDKLLAPPAGVASEIASVLKALPASRVTPTSATPNTVAEESAPPAITQADINAALKANTAAVAQAVAQAAADIAAANPDDAAAQIAATQAALEAAKAAEAAAEAANQPEPEPEPEPSYPVPNTWYTKTCDLSNGLGSCIDYQQVLNASHAFESTALYQFPNLILQCLGYVEGDGCEYPPKLTIELFTRFSTGPIDIDLSPFESVVKVMKFFFSILCLVGTGKATMTLFE